MFFFFRKRKVFFTIFLITFLFLFVLFLKPFNLNSFLIKRNYEAENLSCSAFFQTFNKKENQIGFFEQKEKVEPPELNIIQENSLMSISSPFVPSFQVLSSLTGESINYDQNSPLFSIQKNKEIIEYAVEKGDTFNSIAENFGISVNTILWANNLNSKSKIKPGQVLIILPVSGVLYQVKKGDTLKEIAQTYKGKIDEIIAFNELLSEESIYVGDFLIIPNGSPPVNKKEKKSTNNFSSETPLASSYFIYPTVSRRISQGLHFYNAIDFDGECGDPIYAAAGGTVLNVKFGWNFGIGNYVKILHPNEVVTLYGHLQTILVNPGQEVSQGQIIAFMGGKPGTVNAGISTGCHLHFEIYGAKNPFAK